MKARYYSLDVFRGMTVALMILVNNPGSWSYMFSPLQHAKWHGCTPTDLVFPFFLFAVGNAMAFVMPKFHTGTASFFYKKLIKRTLLIFLIGLGLNWFPFIKWEDNSLIFKHWVNPENSEEGIRIMGVLQRIALSYFFAMMIGFYLSPKKILYAIAGILLGYWVLCYGLGGEDAYSLQGWFGTKWDTKILGISHMYKGEGIPFDPEGLVATLPAIAHILIGYLVGIFINKQGNVNWLWKNTPNSNELHFKMIAGLMVLGFILFISGLFWDLFFPLNKKIWSSSYVIYTAGLGILCLGSIIWTTDVQGIKNGFTKFFDVFGKNPLFIFVLSGLIPRAMNLIRIEKDISETGEILYASPLEWFYLNFCSKVSTIPEIGSFLYSLFFLTLMWSIGYILDKRKIYIKV